MKQCSRCSILKSLDSFFNQKQSKDGKQSWCKDCSVGKLRELRANNKRPDIKSAYSITQEQFDSMLEQQNGVCAICGQPAARGRYQIDHDHSCCPGVKSCGKCVRGLLCRPCNLGLGMFRGSVFRFQQALRYLLDRNKNPRTPFDEAVA